MGHNYIGTEHILLGLVRENEGVAARILLDFDADSEKIRNEVIRMLSGPGGRRQGQGQASSGSGSGGQGRKAEELEAARPVRAQSHALGGRRQTGPCRGADHILVNHADPLRRTKNNPV